MIRLLIGSLLGLLASAAWSHTLAPSLLQISPAADEQANSYNILWRVDVLTPKMAPQWPAYCQTGAAEIQRHQRQLNYHYSLHCSAPLTQGTLKIDGLAQAASAVLLRRLDTQPNSEQLIFPGQPEYAFASPPEAASVWLRYLHLGVEHILAGPDHLLLVLGLFWLGHSLRQMLALSLCFTVGHSLTLVLASLRWISFPQAWVELAIAATLLWLALQLGQRRRAASGRMQLAVFSLFGLIHGLGFAGALKDIGLESGRLLTSLFSFNLGIELGQLLFLAAMSLLVLVSRHLNPRTERLLQGISRYTIGSLACYWCLDRALLLLK